MMLCVWGQNVQPFESWKNMTRHKSGDQPVKTNMPGHFIRMKFQNFLQYLPVKMEVSIDVKI